MIADETGWMWPNERANPTCMTRTYRMISVGIWGKSDSKWWIWDSSLVEVSSLVVLFRETHWGNTHLGTKLRQLLCAIRCYVFAASISQNGNLKNYSGCFKNTLDLQSVYVNLYVYVFHRCFHVLHWYNFYCTFVWGVISFGIIKDEGRTNDDAHVISI